MCFDGRSDRFYRISAGEYDCRVFVKILQLCDYTFMRQLVTTVVCVKIGRNIIPEFNIEVIGVYVCT